MWLACCSVYVCCVWPGTILVLWQSSHGHDTQGSIFAYHWLEHIADMRIQNWALGANEGLKALKKILHVSFTALFWPKKYRFTFASFWGTAVHIRAQSVPLYRMWRNASVDIWLLKIFRLTTSYYSLGNTRSIPSRSELSYVYNATCLSIPRSILLWVFKLKDLRVCLRVFTGMFHDYKGKTYSSNPWLFNSSIHFCVRISILSSR